MMLHFCRQMMKNQQDYETILEFKTAVKVMRVIRLCFSQNLFLCFCCCFLFDFWAFFVCFVFLVFCFAFGPPIQKAFMKSSNRVWIMEMNSKERMKLKQLSNCFIVSLGILWKYPRNLAISSNNFLFIFFLKILPKVHQKFDESYQQWKKRAE